jgi:apolipoprotein N-acyltransferase
MSRPLRQPVPDRDTSGTRPRWQRWGRIVLPSLVSGVFLTLSIPPFGFWILAFPGAAVLWWRLGGLRWPQRLAVGWTAGLGQFVVALWWVLSFNVYGGVVLMVAESLAPALACLFVPPRRGRALALTGGMVLVEALRTIWPFGGLPMGGVALGQAAGPMAAATRLGGPLLLVGMVWLGGCGLGLLATALVRESRRLTAPLVKPAAAGLAALAMVALLAGLGSAASNGGPAHRTIRAAAVQGGGVRGLRKAQVDPVTVYNAQVAATAQIPSVDNGQPPNLILWPEDVVSLNDPIETDPVRYSLAAIARKAHATLVVGVTETVSTTQYRNEIVAFSPTGRIIARYEKVHRVPFGEYVPYRGFFKHLANLSAVPLDAIPGHGNGLLRTPAGPLGAMISYEVFFAQRGWIPTRAGAELLIVPTNTSSYSTSQVPTQEVAAARLQALSEGRDLIQAAPTGFSSVINNDGVVLARTSLGTRQVLVYDVGLRNGLTVYGHFADTPVLIVSALMVLAGWLVAITDRERERERGTRR